MKLTRNSSLEDLRNHFIEVCENNDNRSTKTDSIFGDLDSLRQAKDNPTQMESLEFMMLIKASEQKLIARYEFMKSQIQRYSSIIAVIEASLSRGNTSSKFREMAKADLNHTKEMIDYHRQIFEYTVLSQSNQVFLHFAKEQGDQQLIQTLSNRIVALVDSINTVQNEIEKRSEASKKKLMQNLSGMGKKSFFQSRFS